MEALLIGITFILSPVLTLSQVTRYLDEQGADTDSARATYVVMYLDKLSKSYYLNPKRIRYEETQADDGVVTRTQYYQTGQIMAVGSVKNGRPARSVKSFYENGKPQGELEFEHFELTRVSIVRVINYWDSIGNKIIDNGNGQCTCVLNPFENATVAENGKIVNQLKEGEWTANTAIYSYRETYENGQLQRGTLNYRGESFDYNVIEESAQPAGGMEALYAHVGRVMKYPVKARRQGIQGRVIVQFVVQKDGTLTDTHVINGIGGGCDEEAIRAIMSSPKWKPGKQRGRPVKQRYMLPIQFRLG